MHSQTNRWIAGLTLGVLAVPNAIAAPPPEPKMPEAAVLAEIRRQTEDLGQSLAQLRKNTDDSKLVHAEVFHKAAVWMLKHNQWYTPEYTKWTLAALEQGGERVAALQAGQSPWLTQPGRTIRAYRSEIDASVQPYAVVLPRGYPGEGKRTWRLDVVLKGRDDALTETKFIQQHMRPSDPPEQDYLELHVYGRGNNAYRWAGERDVFEAMEAFQLQEKATHGRPTIDDRRIVLRGFSMGGAGAWHLGLHYPDRWCSVSPGAGFSTTFGPVKNKDGKLPEYQEKCLSIYESLDYAENVFNTPFVAYGGEDDPQLEAAQSIADKVKPLGLPLTLLVGKKTKHAYHPDSLKEIMRLQAEHAARGRPEYPSKVRFVSYYPRHYMCHWVTILGFEKPYSRTVVEAERKEQAFTLKTENVTKLYLELPPDWDVLRPAKVQINGQTLETLVDNKDFLCLISTKSDGRWKAISLLGVAVSRPDRPSKSSTICGPIDDAFVNRFLCVRGTGQPWNADVQKYSEATLKRFAYEWSRWMRGELPLKNDTDFTEDDRKRWTNLVLFGDPGSNSLMAEEIRDNPASLIWTRDTLQLADKTFAAAHHVPAMIYPRKSDRGPSYLVINSGHTFHEADFLTTNRMLFPKLGDYAILKPAPTENDPCAAEVITAGLFDENWQVPK